MSHHIEEIARVYLRLNDEGTAWEVDGPTGDGYPLEGYEGGPAVGDCHDELEGEDIEHDDDECDAILAKARQIDLPDAEQLYVLLGRYLGRDPS